ncbi:MAG: SIMPL domain-containing protein [Mycobacteriales bacterium]
MPVPDGDHEAPLNAIVVVGEGSARVSPDIAVFDAALETRAESAGAALGLVTQRARAVLDAAKAQGVPDADLQTHGMSLRPLMDREARRVIGYVASYALALRLRDIATAPAVVDAVSGAAGDSLRLGGFHLLTSTTDAARAEAGARAVEDARRRAESMAGAAGVRLGRVLAIAEAGLATPRPAPGAPRVVAAAASSGAAVPMEAGSTELSARVTVRFEILD